MSTYIISDLHFGHDKLCRNLRGMSAEESDALIIKNWNNVVNKHDKVIVLGDITMDKPELIKKYIPMLHGAIEVVLGNHDKPRCVKALVECGIKVSSVIKYRHKYLLTHIPIDRTQLTERYTGNIHGHIHTGESMHESPNDPRYYNVNCEFHDYTPIDIDEVIARLHKNINDNVSQFA